MSDFYDQVYGQDFPVEGIPHGWIQWKGTNICIDLHCKCGAHCHFDGDFFYAYECPNCHAKYAVGQNVKLIELTPEQVADPACHSFATCEPDDELDDDVGDG